MVKVILNAINYANKYVKSLIKIIYSMVQNNLPLNQFSQLVQLGRALESPNLISNSSSIMYSMKILLLQKNYYLQYLYQLKRNYGMNLIKQQVLVL